MTQTVGEIAGEQIRRAREAWWQQAACANWPDFTLLPEHVQAGWCHDCIVRAECLLAALDEEAGLPASHRAEIRGGLTPAARRRLRHPQSSTGSERRPRVPRPAASKSEPRTPRSGEGPAGPGFPSQGERS